MGQGHTQRISPSGPAVGVARIAIAAPVAFTDGVDLVIPFSVIEYSRGFVGDFITPTADGGIFVVNPGFYLVQCQVQLSVAPTTVAINAGIASGSDDDFVNQICSGATSEASMTVNALRLSTEDPISPGVPAAAGAILHCVGASGNLVSAEMLIYQLGRQA